MTATPAAAEVGAARGSLEVGVAARGSLEVGVAARGSLEVGGAARRWCGAGWPEWKDSVRR